MCMLIQSFPYAYSEINGMSTHNQDWYDGTTNQFPNHLHYVYIHIVCLISFTVKQIK